MFPVYFWLANPIQDSVYIKVRMKWGEFFFKEEVFDYNPYAQFQYKAVNFCRDSNDKHFVTSTNYAADLAQKQ